MKRILLMLLLWCAALAGHSEAAQHEGHQMAPTRPAPTAATPPSPNPQKVLGWEPIRCWRQTTAGAVSVGESFTVVVTCAVYESDNAQVVPDESRLNVASIQMAPFEILGASHPPDVHRGSRRFFQYDYQLRIISPDVVGRDINVPPLPISYRIHSRIGAAATLEGRDLSYLLPMLPIRILSLVPTDASDIRDASEASLAAVDSLRFRSSLFRVLTIAFGALAAVMLVLAFIPLARSRTVAATGDPGRLPDRAWLNRVADELDDVRTRVVEGWTDETLVRAAAAVRLIAAAAIDHPISQRPFTTGPVPEGRILVQHGLIKPRKMTVASAVTTADVARVAVDGQARSTTRQQQLEGLQSALDILSNAQYRREPIRDSSALDDAIRDAVSVGRDLANERNWWRNRWAGR